jgi:ribose transport system permease protein
MGLVLLLLCVYYSWATWGTDYAAGHAAAHEVAAALPASAVTTGVVVAAQEGDDAVAFVQEVTAELKRRGVPVLAVGQGAPSDLRQKLEELAAAGRPAEMIVATRQASKWFYVTGLKGVKVVAPREYSGPVFLTRSNLVAIADRIAVIAIIGTGMTMVILTGGIDLSVGSLIALCAVVVALLIRAMGGAQASVGATALAAGAGVAVCAVVGLFNGVMVTVFRMPPFIVTLGTMLMAGGLARELSGGQSINEVPGSFVWLGRGRVLGGVPVTVVLMGVLYAAAAVLMSRMAVGRYVYAIGGNAEGAFYAAVPVRRVVIFTYVACAALAGVGGVVETSRLQSGAPTYGQLAELSVIAAVVVGGTSLSGGRGGVVGTLVGALIIAVMGNGMNLTKVEPYRQDIVLGAVILGAVLVDRWRAGGR